MRRSRVAGIVISAILFALAVTLWRSMGQSRSDAGAVVARRGGQLVAAIRSEPGTLNRLVRNTAGTELLTMLTQGRLVRLNRATLEIEPWLAEGWKSSDDGRTHIFYLRKGVVWSDGTPFTTADVLFTLKAVFDPRLQSVLASSLTVAREPIRAHAPDAHTLVVTYAGPSGHGVKLLDNLPIYPKHKLEAALADGTLDKAWSLNTPPSDLVGTGPFVVREYVPAQRVVLERNPRYWRKAADGGSLPYLDRLVLEIVPDQNAELLRLLSGDLDVMYDSIRTEDFVAAQRADRDGRVKLVELGIATDADAFWFCLKPEARKKDPRFAFVRRPEFRQAISHAVNREAFADTVFLGEAVPVWGPVTLSNRAWFSPNVPRYGHDLGRARALLKSIGLDDRDGNGVVEDAAGAEARFSVLTVAGTSYALGTTVLKEHAAKIGIALDVAVREGSSIAEHVRTCSYDAFYLRPVATDLDPAGNLDFWLSSGASHFWNAAQKAPATEWEQRIDTLMGEQVASLDPQRRKDLFEIVQRILGENVPVLYFAAPRMWSAHNARVAGVQPSVLRPPILWSADTLSLVSR